MTRQCCHRTPPRGSVNAALTAQEKDFDTPVAATNHCTLGSWFERDLAPRRNRTLQLTGHSGVGPNVGVVVKDVVRIVDRLDCGESGVLAGAEGGPHPVVLEFGHPVDVAARA